MAPTKNFTIAPNATANPIIGNNDGTVVAINSNPPAQPNLNYTGTLVSSGFIGFGVVSTWTLTATPSAGSYFVGWNYANTVGLPAQPILNVNPLVVPDQPDSAIIYPIFAPLPAPSVPIVTDPQALTTNMIANKVVVADCCIVAKNCDYTDQFKRNVDCYDLASDIELMVGLTDSIRGYVVEGDPISGTQSSVYMNFSTVTAGKTLIVTINETDAVGAPILAIYTMVAPSSVILDFVGYMANIINNKHCSNPQLYPYTALASTDNGGTVYIYGSKYAEDDLQYLTYTYTFGEFFWNSPNYFLNGITTATQPKNCISLEGVRIILNKLNNLCSKPCDEVANF